MNRQMQFLYQQIKECNITKEDAINKMKTLDIYDDSKESSEFYIYDEPFLKDHKINSEQIIIGASYASLALKYFFKIFPDEKCVQMKRLLYILPIIIKNDGIIEVTVNHVLKDQGMDAQVMYRESRNEPGKW